MTIAPYIREIGRGKDGARSLSRDAAFDLMIQVLDGRVSDLELGAFALAMRIKGESVAELDGFLAAVQARSWTLEPPAPAVVLPSYNGARKLPNLTPLLALALARQGVPVLVHGAALDPGRVTTAEVFAGLGIGVCGDAAAIVGAWARGEPAFVLTETICPPLAALLAVRRVVGLRNSGHTVAKLLDPCRPGTALRVVNYTHPEYAALLAEFIATAGIDALLMRGTEGEPVANARRLQKLEVFLAGATRPELSAPAREGVLGEIAALPAIEAAATATFVRHVLAGGVAMPEPIARQIEVLLATLATLAALGPRGLRSAGP